MQVYLIDGEELAVANSRRAAINLWRDRYGGDSFRGHTAELLESRSYVTLSEDGGDSERRVRVSTLEKLSPCFIPSLR